MTVTLFYASCLGLLFLALTLQVIRARHAAGASAGDGGDAVLARRIRGHANFAEFAPIGLILLGLLEAGGLPVWALHVLGAAFTLGRVLHGIGFGFMTFWAVGRMGGTGLTLGALAGMVLAGFVVAIG